MNVRPKKSLGQHFLKDESIAQRIVESLLTPAGAKVLEIGAGTGVLTKYLAKNKEIDFSVIEFDWQSVNFLKEQFAELKEKIVLGDFLELDIPEFSPDPFYIIGNFPYNISSQILFRVYENKNLVSGVVGMFQKEVAERIASPPGYKNYGILSVLLQTCYDIEYLFTVEPDVFYPRPKVRSGVIRLTRNTDKVLVCDEALFKKVVKAAFNQRRKMLTNALNALKAELNISFALPFANKRAEQLSWNQFEEITLAIQYANK